VSRLTQEQQQVLDREQVAHLLAGDPPDDATPPVEGPSLVEARAVLRSPQRVRGVQILHQQCVLDPGGRAEQESALRDRGWIFGEVRQVDVHRS
jgi:hypothetical protein